MNNERREYPKRPESVNLVYFAVFNDLDKLRQQGMGKTLNISEGGILLETYEKIADEGTIVLTLGLRDETVDIQAKTAHLSELENGIFHTGLSFIIENPLQLDRIKQYILLFESMNDKK
ncbi:MAG: PilZ domain-containing protein [Desulfobacteraceae bacterium]|nr:PilZ domain-containing protein [Desulfobacteraceae bacterium]